MSLFGRHMHGGLVAAVVAILAAGVVGVAMWGPPSGGAAREIRLVARDMAYYLESDPATRNPTLHVRPGERVRIVLVNDDRGMTHDVAVPAAQRALDAVDWQERGQMVFTAPATPGDYEYVCRPHASLNMRGTLRVAQ